MVLLSESPLKAIVIPYLCATSAAMKLTSACSAALPSAVATSRVAPGISFADLAGFSCGRPMAAASPRTRTPAPAIQGHLRRRLSSKP